MASIQWLITDTSPQIVIPEAHVYHWRGVYEPVASADQADISIPAGHFCVG